MKHVVFAHSRLPFRGAERFVIEQVAALAELPVRVSLLLRRRVEKSELEVELRRRNPNVESILSLPWTWACLRWLERERPDLLVLEHHASAIRALRLLGWGGVHIPTIVTLQEHDCRYLRRYRAVSHRVDSWICAYDFVAQVNELLGQQPCRVIHPPIFSRPAEVVGEEAKRSARRSLGIPQDGFVVGYVGRVTRRTEPLVALRLAEMLDAGRSADASGSRPLHFLVAGREDAEMALALDRALDRSLLAHRAHRLGALPDTLPALAALDLFVMTGSSEGFLPRGVIEAMEREIPVIAPTVGGIPTVLEDGRGSFLLHRIEERKGSDERALWSVVRRVLPWLEEPGGWEEQGRRARQLLLDLHRRQDAAALFREVVRPWIGEESLAVPVRNVAVS